MLGPYWLQGSTVPEVHLNNKLHEESLHQNNMDQSVFDPLTADFEFKGLGDHGI